MADVISGWILVEIFFFNRLLFYSPLGAMVPPLPAGMTGSTLVPTTIRQYAECQDLLAKLSGDACQCWFSLVPHCHQFVLQLLHILFWLLHEMGPGNFSLLCIYVFC